MVPKDGADFYNLPRPRIKRCTLQIQHADWYNFWATRHPAPGATLTINTATWQQPSHAFGRFTSCMKILRSKYRLDDNIGTHTVGVCCEELVCINLFRDKFSLGFF
jgi:hypothetical protein